MKIAFLTFYNLYESKRHFAQKFSEALKRKGMDLLLLNLKEEEISHEEALELIKFKPDVTLSFNTFTKNDKGLYLWDYLKIPHITLLVDPPIYTMDLLKSPFAGASAVDEKDVSFLHRQGYKNAFFLPHAIEKDAFYDGEEKRIYPVVFIGSVYDYESAKKSWESKYSENVSQKIEEIIHKTQNSTLSFVEAIEGIYPEGLNDLDLIFYVDTYLRGYERLQLIRSIKTAEVHIFGDIGWQKPYAARGWQDLLKDSKNVIFHKPVSYEESLKILERAKVSLNSMPFFKQGTHERIFASLAKGAALLTSDNIWVNTHFENEKDLFLFDVNHLENVNSIVEKLLTDETFRRASVQSGRRKVLENHTWDNRAETLLKFIS